MSTNDIRGRFVWYELLTDDPGAASGFYTDLFGWGEELWEGDGEPYTVWSAGDRMMAGAMKLPEEAKAQGAVPAWLPYMGTPDVDATVDRARELGAHVHMEPTDIPSVGRIAVLADPQGASFAVFRPEGEDGAHGPAAPPEHGHFSWHELATSDWKGALDFYRELFGWEETDQHDMGEAGVYQMYGKEGRPYGGMFDLPEGHPHWMLYVTVSDLDETVERVTRAGGQLLNGPMQVPGGSRVAQCRDPEGAAFALHEPAEG